LTGQLKELSFVGFSLSQLAIFFETQPKELSQLALAYYLFVSRLTLATYSSKVMDLTKRQ